MHASRKRDGGLVRRGGDTSQRTHLWMMLCCSCRQLPMSFAAIRLEAVISLLLFLKIDLFLILYLLLLLCFLYEILHRYLFQHHAETENALLHSEPNHPLCRHLLPLRSRLLPASWFRRKSGTLHFYSPLANHVLSSHLRNQSVSFHFLNYYKNLINYEDWENLQVIKPGYNIRL